MAENPAAQAASESVTGEPPLGTVSAQTLAPQPALAQPSFLQRVREDLFKPKPKEAKQKGKDAPKGDSLREVIETIVFVVVLVLMLKAFVAEAFIIPTGSMATSLLGYHRHAHCDKCGCNFTVNASMDADEFRWWQTGPASSAVCPNCRNVQELGTGIEGGNKVLVLKPQYDFSLPARWDVIVFKFPGKLGIDGERDGGPQENFAAKNYIKRLWGLPGEKLSIWHGDIYLVTLDEAKNPKRSILSKPPPEMIRMRRPVNNNDEQASDLKGTLPPHWADEAQGTGWTADAEGKQFTLAASAEERRLKFRNLIRPAPLPGDALRRFSSALRGIDNALRDAERERYQGTDQVLRTLRPIEGEFQKLEAITLLPTAAKSEDFRAQAGRLETALRESEESLALLRKAEAKDDNPLGSGFNPKETLRLEFDAAREAVRKLGEQWKTALEIAQQPQLATDFLGYNALISANDPSGYTFPRDLSGGHEPHWVKDIMLECEVEVTQPGGDLTVEINAGVDVHRARFDLGTGECTLQVLRFGADGQSKEIATQKAATRLKGTGKHRLQFGNFDDRLTLWVNNRLPFGDGLSFAGPGPDERGPRAGDVKPISLVAKNAGVTVGKLQVWRDIYYTRSPRETPEYEDFRFVDRSALGVATLLSLPARDAALPPASRIERWDGFGRQKPWYYPMGLKNDFGRDLPDPELPNGPPLGPEEYFALGDNSTRSSDSREWGSVPHRLLLGKAVFTYWPMHRFGTIE